MGRVTERRRVTRLRDGRRDARPDALAAEEPLEIRVGGRALAVTMRTPGHDFDLVAGYLVAEGVAATAEDVPALRYCAGTNAEGINTYNVVDARVARPETVPVSAYRSLLTSSACGLCGAETVDAVRKRLPADLSGDPLTVTEDVLFSLPDTLRASQRAFDATGGLHAAGLFTADGRLLCLREDVGRHNAVDKVIGWALREDLLPLRGHLLMVSGRASFELVQKAAMAGIPLLAAVSAPSALAVDLAEEAGLTLVGFLRGRSANLYTGAERVLPAPVEAVAR
ncbi:formate dehydrogenase accessory sulfurtransferase FdhD [Streptacidiphilus neutrinimicus]|uniref:formate dehydrogenase accessory sulfurtransferase FdhD n=1 Tax=Streptacidiphilus neutrinimicus TaxID=105420 RepID=UPI0005A62E41|nr:formate dehydrogenase accessory sulfurtransferase FdhD [Streptacidiphilus neutrinimicus]